MNQQTFSKPAPSAQQTAVNRTDKCQERQASQPYAATVPNSTQPVTSYFHPTIAGSLVEQPCLRCYEHGCDGRTFSRIENYKRHLREKNGMNTVSCSLCDKVFTRKSNMDKHISDGKCSTIREIEQTVLALAQAGTETGYEKR